VVIDAVFATDRPVAPPRAAGSSRREHAWEVLAGVLDPEVPVVSVVDLGIVRDVIDEGDALVVVVTPTYSGCPATEVIEASIVAALDAAGLGPTRVRMQRAPAWTSDWISAEGKEKLRGYGIAPPGPVDLAQGAPLRFVRRAVAPLACPRCESLDTERLAAFGSTACKALWRCRACGEPFEHFKPI
jgi:ring-1,2-phenylacetyl-CoA epoxidase subunit PaaD